MLALPSATTGATGSPWEAFRPSVCPSPLMRLKPSLARAEAAQVAWHVIVCVAAQCSDPHDLHPVASAAIALAACL
jgi:hypothetical protein